LCDHPEKSQDREVIENSRNFLFIFYSLDKLYLLYIIFTLALVVARKLR